MNKTLILIAASALAVATVLAAAPSLAAGNGCSPGVNYSYSASMSPDAVATHKAVQASATCAKPTDPTEYIRLSLIRAKQNPGGGGGDGGNR
jgi:hypothetical protein